MFDSGAMPPIITFYNAQRIYHFNAQNILSYQLEASDSSSHLNFCFKLHFIQEITTLQITFVKISKSFDVITSSFDVGLLKSYNVGFLKPFNIGCPKSTDVGFSKSFDSLKLIDVGTLKLFNV